MLGRGCEEALLPVQQTQAYGCSLMLHRARIIAEGCSPSMRSLSEHNSDLLLTDLPNTFLQKAE